MDISAFGDFGLLASAATTVTLDPESTALPTSELETSVANSVLFYALLLNFLAVGAFGVLGLVGLITNSSPVKKIGGIGLLVSIGLMFLIVIASVVVRF